MCSSRLRPDIGDPHAVGQHPLVGHTAAFVADVSALPVVKKDQVVVTHRKPLVGKNHVGLAGREGQGVGRDARTAGRGDPEIDVARISVGRRDAVDRTKRPRARVPHGDPIAALLFDVDPPPPGKLMQVGSRPVCSFWFIRTKKTNVTSLWCNGSTPSSQLGDIGSNPFKDKRTSVVLLFVKIKSIQRRFNSLWSYKESRISTKDLSDKGFSGDVGWCQPTLECSLAGV